MYKELNKYKSILILSNTSWYLKHYRLGLIKQLKNDNINVTTVALEDEYTNEIKKYSVFIPWLINRRKITNPIYSFIYFIKLFFILKRSKPDVVHSHTLYPNLLVMLMSFLIKKKLVLSFAGLGKSKSIKKRQSIFLIFYIKLISFLSWNNEIFSRNKKQLYLKTHFIFQNDSDREIFKSYSINKKSFATNTIYGSGLPSYYMNIVDEDKKGFNLNGKKALIFCARLISNKGINMFIRIAKKRKDINFLVFGDIDNSQEGSLSLKDILEIQIENKNIEFFGQKKDPLLNLNQNQFNILLVPSIYGEGFPRSIIEAGSQLIPVISNNFINKSHAYSKYIYSSEEHSINGYLNQLGKIEDDLSKGILEEKLYSMRDLVLDNYMEDDIVKKTMKIYN